MELFGISSRLTLELNRPYCCLEFEIKPIGNTFKERKFGESLVRELHCQGYNSTIH